MNKKKEVVAVVIGLFLIIFVATFTFIRSVILSKKDNSQTAIEKNTAKYEIISAENLRQKIEKQEDILIVDIRAFEDYASEHILDSLHLPLEQINSYEERFKSSVALLSGISHDENSLNEITSFFLEKGATKVLLLKAGLESWKLAGGQTVSHGDPTTFTDQSKVTYISQEELKNKIDQNEKLFILDVREKKAFDEGHLPGAYNIPLPEIEKRRLEVFSTNPVIIYSNMEIEAFQAAVRLYDMRFLSSLILKEGYSKWVSNNFKTEK